MGTGEGIWTMRKESRKQKRNTCGKRGKPSNERERRRRRIERSVRQKKPPNVSENKTHKQPRRSHGKSVHPSKILRTYLE